MHNFDTMSWGLIFDLTSWQPRLGLHCCYLPTYLDNLCNNIETYASMFYHWPPLWDARLRRPRPFDPAACKSARSEVDLAACGTIRAVMDLCRIWRRRARGAVSSNNSIIGRKLLLNFVFQSEEVTSWYFKWTANDIYNQGGVSPLYFSISPFIRVLVHQFPFKS